MADNENKIKRIQVPNKYVDNKNFDNKSFYLYVNLKLVCINNQVNIYKNKLLEKLQWTQYQLRKYLKELKAVRLIDYDFEDLPKFKPMEIAITPIIHNKDAKDTYFTQVDTGTIYKILEHSNEVKIKVKKDEPKVIRDVKEKALRLFYIYEMYYNEEYGCAFVGYEKIKDSMNINNKYIKVINDIFNKNQLVAVMIGDWRIDNINNTIRRNPNNYIPYCDRAKKKEKKE